MPKASPPPNRGEINPGRDGHFMKDRAALTGLVLQQYHCTAIGGKHIEVVIVVVVAYGDAHAINGDIGPRTDRDIGEAPIATACPVIAPQDIAFPTIIDDIDIGIPIVVVVEKADGEAQLSNLCRIENGRDISERAISIVVVQNILGTREQ